MTYTYAVTAVDASGNESAFSNKVKVMPSYEYTKPKGGLPPTPDGEDRIPPSPPLLWDAESTVNSEG